MPAFKFKLSQCVMVPGEQGVQGRVSGRSEFVGAPNLYQLAWLDGAVTLQHKVWPEEELSAAQPVALVDQALTTDIKLPEVTFSASTAVPIPRPMSRYKRKAKR